MCLQPTRCATSCLHRTQSHVKCEWNKTHRHKGTGQQFISIQLQQASNSFQYSFQYSCKRPAIHFNTLATGQQFISIQLQEASNSFQYSCNRPAIHFNTPATGQQFISIQFSHTAPKDSLAESADQAAVNAIRLTDEGGEGTREPGDNA